MTANGPLVLSEVKQYLGITGTSEDTWLNYMLGGTWAFLDAYLGRDVFPATGSTRYFECKRPWVSDDRKTLRFYADVTSIQSLTNGDGEVLAVTAWTLLGDAMPYWGVRILDNSTKRFIGYPNQIEVVAAWGAYTSAAYPLNFVALRIIQHMYQARQSGTGGALTVASRQTGIVVEPSMLPPEIIRELELYRRHGIS